MKAVNDLRGKRVFVGLSGGVDSAVTAALIQKSGADVTGVYIKGWYPPGMPCTWREDRADAMRVAAHLGIPFMTHDASEAYRVGVIEYLTREYRAGRTPNPDIMCNREVKFGAFVSFAKEHGADYIATGHYARMHEGKLLRGVDASKDQSYFLWAVPQEAREMTLFPLGSMQKSEVRKMARSLKLPNATKPDSQGICFLGAVSVEDYLRGEFGEVPGIATDTEGNAVGEHNGVLLHTIGSRIALTNATPGPWYVIAKDIATNTLTVSRNRTSAVAVSSLPLTDVNVLNAGALEGELQAQYRYHGPRITGTYDAEHHVFTPSTPLPEALAPGQSLVLYNNDEVVLGGIMA